MKHQKPSRAQKPRMVHRKCRNHFSCITSFPSPELLGTRRDPHREISHRGAKVRAEPQHASLLWTFAAFASGDPPVFTNAEPCCENCPEPLPLHLLLRAGPVARVRPVPRSQAICELLLYSLSEFEMPQCLAIYRTRADVLCILPPRPQHVTFY